MPSKTRTRLERQKRKLQSSNRFTAKKDYLTEAVKNHLSGHNETTATIPDTKENGIAALSASAN